jgi:hypothetical protein
MRRLVRVLLESVSISLNYITNHHFDKYILDALIMRNITQLKGNKHEAVLGAMLNFANFFI